MKQRVIEILKELREVCTVENIYPSHDTLFREALSCYRGEKAGESKFEQKKTSKLATANQIAYVTQLADNKKRELKLTGKETSLEISKLIEELRK